MLPAPSGMEEHLLCIMYSHYFSRKLWGYLSALLLGGPAAQGEGANHRGRGAKGEKRRIPPRWYHYAGLCLRSYGLGVKGLRSRQGLWQ